MGEEFDPNHVDPEQAHDVATRRKAERQRLLAERAAMAVEARHEASRAIADHLDRVFADRFGFLHLLTISAWWPIKAELNLRTWLAGLAARGAQAVNRLANLTPYRRPILPPPFWCQDQARFLKRQDSLPVSMISQWRVRQSKSAVIIFASPNMVGHSPKVRLVVTVTEVRS